MLKQPLADKIKVSVILSYYNTEEWLVKRAIDSVFKQDFRGFELLVVNDGNDTAMSQDLTGYINRSTIDTSYFYHENIGQSYSINEAIPFCKGDYITIIDADDEYKSNHLSACMNEIKYADLIASNSEIIADCEEDYYVVDKYNTHEMHHVDECILFATLFGKKEVFEKHPFKKMYSADSDFFENASKDFLVKKVDLRTYIYYRNNPNSICSTYKREQIMSDN